mgnify:CR=1 FL=1
MKQVMKYILSMKRERYSYDDNILATYSKQGDIVKVKAVVDEGSLAIFFSDSGCGIAPEDLPNIKKKFYKANIQVRGSGIGLAVVDEIVKLHKGIFEINRSSWC